MATTSGEPASAAALPDELEQLGNARSAARAAGADRSKPRDAVRVLIVLRTMRFVGTAGNIWLPSRVEKMKSER
jgi:hypothetical protein